MDWKFFDLFFFLFWVCIIFRVFGFTSEVYFDVGKVGRGLSGFSWEGGRDSVILGIIRFLGVDRGLFCCCFFFWFKLMIVLLGYMIFLLKGFFSVGSVSVRGFGSRFRREVVCFLISIRLFFSCEILGSGSSFLSLCFYVWNVAGIGVYVLWGVSVKFRTVFSIELVVWLLLLLFRFVIYSFWNEEFRKLIEILAMCEIRFF